MHILRLLLLVPCVWLSAAEKPPAPKAPSHFMFAAGSFNFDQTHPRFEFQGEFRWELLYYHLRPLVSAFVTTDRSFYVCGGLAYDILLLGKRIALTPSFAPGLYYRGCGKNLGFPLNFRSAVELAVILPNQGRLGAQVNHISNSGLSKTNPGADSLLLFYAIPL